MSMLFHISVIYQSKVSFYGARVVHMVVIYSILETGCLGILSVQQVVDTCVNILDTSRHMGKPTDA